MSEKTFFTLDFRDFDIHFAKIVEEQIPKETEDALFQAGSLALADAIEEKPTVPKKTGHLRRSQRVEVKKEKNEIYVLCGFNTNYAAKLHEAPSNWNWTEPGSGPKFLESTLQKNAKKYMKFVADKIKKEAK